MSAPQGNQFWKARSSHGATPIFKTEGQLWEACCEYFQWVEDNPLKEEKLFAYQGEIVKDTGNKMRAMTMAGLCIFLDICEKTWWNYREKDDFVQVITRVEKVIYNQKFTGASADLLNANIIARDLGLRDLSRQEQTGKDGGPIEYSDKTEEEIDKRIKSLMAETSDEP